MPVAQIYVKNLLLYYDVKRYPKGFECYDPISCETFYNENKADIDRDCPSLGTSSRYPRCWMLMTNVISLCMAAAERDCTSTLCSIASAFCGSCEMAEDGSGSSFQDSISRYLRRSNVASDNHLRSLVDKT
jgi:hypothetical protein